ncbi:hypothetical protein MtrunA17_Chr2g0313951 [Medicago truncatula]|uniref:Uncharacterized protein n=1 Tax=Medicago truncatula TaxID=3880 RepID=A0A396JBU9_MEDTR|nr:hypothetical protein MtrunA17_Chr2g0313951 [Medicago truncatula]
MFGIHLLRRRVMSQCHSRVTLKSYKHDLQACRAFKIYSLCKENKHALFCIASCHIDHLCLNQSTWCNKDIP